MAMQVSLVYLSRFNWFGNDHKSLTIGPKIRWMVNHKSLTIKQLGQNISLMVNFRDLTMTMAEMNFYCGHGQF